MPIQKVNQKVNVATDASTTEHHRKYDDYDHDHNHHRDHDVSDVKTKLMADWLKFLLPFLITALLAGIASIYERVTTLEKGTFHNELIDHRLKTLESYHNNRNKKEGK